MTYIRLLDLGLQFSSTFSSNPATNRFRLLWPEDKRRL